jgi:hypothetical protein
MSAVQDIDPVRRHRDNANIFSTIERTRPAAHRDTVEQHTLVSRIERYLDPRRVAQTRLIHVALGNVCVAGATAAAAEIHLAVEQLVDCAAGDQLDRIGVRRDHLGGLDPRRNGRDAIARRRGAGGPRRHRQRERDQHRRRAPSYRPQARRASAATAEPPVMQRFAIGA